MNRIERAEQKEVYEQANADEVYNCKEACAILNVSEPTLRKLLKAGTISAVKMGRRWFISRRAIYSAIDPNRENSLNSLRPSN